MRSLNVIMRSLNVIMQRLILLVLLTIGAGGAVQTSGQGETACAAFTPADAGAPFYLGLGDVFTLRGRSADALAAYTCAIEHDPTWPEAFVRRGDANSAQFNTAAALADYDRALALDPGLIAAYNNRGVLYSQAANYQLAFDDFAQAIALAPAFVPAYINRALLHAAEGSYTLALEDLEQATALDVGGAHAARAHTVRGAIYLALAAEQYAAVERLTGQPAQYTAADALTGALEAIRTNDPSVWFRLQQVTEAL